ncbi:unnamed protein product [Blepharisma stoltei]|uniref:Uncharacterized protein n=1 Tax=Blepharisma stoltei TaxID=1481888 RepID=A0AAU9J7J2_9CILI|nr:unnamed protein product [Blepharisma stoltei]
MGCCQGRSQKPLQSINAPTKKEEPDTIDKAYFSSISSNFQTAAHNYYRNNFRVTSVDSRKVNEELEEFYNARASVDINKLAKLLSSETVFTLDEGVLLHPWAENPRTIGALTAMQIGIFASDNDILKDSKFNEGMLSSRVLELLLNFAASLERYKFEASILTLSYLSKNNPDIAEALIKRNALPIFIRHMRDGKEGLRSTAALCCRNLYVGRQNMQKLFVREGGCSLLVHLLKSDDSSTVFETILNILDLILDNEDTIQLDIKRHLEECHIVKHLQTIIEKSDKYDQNTISEAIKLKNSFE